MNFLLKIICEFTLFLFLYYLLTTYEEHFFKLSSFIPEKIIFLTILEKKTQKFLITINNSKTFENVIKYGKLT